MHGWIATPISYCNATSWLLGIRDKMRGPQ
jgi:hypothetical protein